MVFIRNTLDFQMPINDCFFVTVHLCLIFIYIQPFIKRNQFIHISLHCFDQFFKWKYTRNEVFKMQKSTFITYHLQHRYTLQLFVASFFSVNVALSNFFTNFKSYLLLLAPKAESWFIQTSHSFSCFSGNDS